MLESRKYIVLVLFISILLSGCSNTKGKSLVAEVPALSVDSTLSSESIDEEDVEGHQIIAQNEKYNLYLNESALSIIIRDRNTKKIMRSAISTENENDSPMWKTFTKSGISIEYFAGSATTASRADMFVKNPERKIERIKNGFNAYINYTSLGISFTVTVVLTEKGLDVSVPDSSITETGENKLASIYVFPFLGYTLLNEIDGYMFIPDGCGALIPLEDNTGKYKQPYTARVFGSDLSVEEEYENVQLFDDKISMYVPPQNVVAPVFGMIHTENELGFLGVVKEGGCYSEINAYPSGVVTQYNWVTAKYIYRQTYFLSTSKTKGIPAVSENRNRFNINTQYRFVSDKNANYSGLALAYREYLTENSMLPEHRLDSNIRVDLFGGDVEKWLIFKRLIPVTTTQQAAKLLNDLADNGITDIFAVYMSYLSGGRFANCDKEIISISKKLGGNQGLNELIENCKKRDIKFLLDCNVSDISSRTGVSSDKIIYRINNKILQNKTYRNIYKLQYHLNPSASAEIAVNGIKKAKEMSLDGFAISGISNLLYSDFNKSGSCSRVTAQNINMQTAAKMNDSVIVAMHSPLEYMWKYCSAYLEFPLYTSDYKLVKEEIPFFAIALSGKMSLYSDYINFQVDDKDFFLRMIESGVRPSVLLSYSSSNELIQTDSNDIYSTEYKSYLEILKNYYESFEELFDATSNAAIISHNRIGDLAVCKYENDTEVYVNFSDTEQCAPNGLLIKAKDYMVIQNEK